MPFKCKCTSTLFDLWLEQNEITDADAKQAEWLALARGKEHTHDALEDAREQGTVYFNLVHRFAAAVNSGGGEAVRRTTAAKRVKK